MGDRVFVFRDSDRCLLVLANFQVNYFSYMVIFLQIYHYTTIAHIIFIIAYSTKLLVQHLTPDAS
jgi:hypothetical protein